MFRAVQVEALYLGQEYSCPNMTAYVRVQFKRKYLAAVISDKADYPMAVPYEKITAAEKELDEAEKAFDASCQDTTHNCDFCMKNAIDD